MSLALKRENKPMTLEAMKKVADFYTDAFVKDLAALNIKRPHKMPRASEHIEAQKALIATLLEKEYAYRTSDGVYFDISRFPTYGKLGNIDIEGERAGARVEENIEKRDPRDFALWKRNNELGWDTPWGKGFPGWHIECSAMSMQYLGKQIDIHTGGIDHIPIHHNNEIAQSEAATGRQYVQVWMHNAFVNIEGTKFSKSLGNTIKLHQLIEHGYDSLAYRYWLLTAHYNTPVNFTWTALDAAKQAYGRLEKYFVETLLPLKEGEVNTEYRRMFHEAINNNLDTPRAIALVWELIKNKEITEGDKKATLLDFDQVLGLGLIQDKNKFRAAVPIAVVELKDLPEEVRLMVIAREEMRDQKNWERADELRKEISDQGYTIEDLPKGPKVTKL
jgi:cysteinyl-tRNA synthetase